MMKRYSREWSVAAAFGLLLLVLAVAGPGFFRARQLLSTLSAALPMLIVASGMGIVIISRHIDVSVGSQFAICSVLAGLLVREHWPLALAALTALAAGLSLGAFNGFFVAALGLPSIVVTLGVMVTWREALRWWRQGEFVRDLPSTFQWFGLDQIAGQVTIIAVSAGLFLLLAWALKGLSAGRFVYAAGSDAEAARLAGLRPRWITFWVFVLMGGLTAVAAVLSAVRFTDVDPNTGSGLEFSAIAAVVVGGVAISGGRGNLWGVLAGVLLLACIAPALVFFRWPAQWEKAFQGLIILAAVAADNWRSRSELAPRPEP
jgi:rhamnose transport system permease protein